MGILSFNPTQSGIYQSIYSRQLMTLSAQSPTSILNYRLQQYQEEGNSSLLRGLNLKLFNLRVSAEKLANPSWEGVMQRWIVVSSNPQILTAQISFTNTSDFQQKFASFSAAEITGNPFATPNTKLSGVFGYLLINGKKISIGTSKVSTDDTRGIYDTLNSIASRINNTEDLEIKAEVLDNRLVLTSPSGRDLSAADKTLGGDKGGLGLRVLPVWSEEEVLSQFIPNLTSPLTIAQIQKVSSFSASLIADNPSATADTILWGVSGNLNINGKLVTVNTAGIADTLNTIAERINRRLDIGVKAEVENNRLILTSLDFAKPISIIDETKGGFAGGPQGLGLSRSANSGGKDTSSATYQASYQVKVVGIAKAQKNISYQAGEITGNEQAETSTPLGLSGYLTINETKIYLNPTQSLDDLRAIINSLSLGVEASLSDGQLILASSSPTTNTFTLEDQTTGGLRGGLGIGRPSTVVKGASAQLITGNLEANADTYLTEISGLLKINGKEIILGLPNSTDTLSRIAERINQTSGIGVVASIEDDRLVLRSTSASAINIEDYTTGGYAGGKGALGLVTSSSTFQAPQNAVYTVDERIYSQPSNLVRDGIPGVIFTLRSPSSLLDGEVITVATQVTSQNSIELVESSIQSFVEDYNQVMTSLNEYLTLTSEEKGAFYQNQTLLNFRDKLKGNVLEGVESATLSLSQVGITTVSNGKKDFTLKLSKSKLSELLASNLIQVVSLFNNPEDGIALRVAKQLNSLVLGDGIPDIDIGNRLRFTLYQPSKLPVTLGTTGQEGSIVNWTV